MFSRFATPAVGFAVLTVALAGCMADEEEEPAGSPSPTLTEPYRYFLPPDSNLTLPLKAIHPTNFLVTPVKGPANELVIAVNPSDPLNLVAGAKDYFLGTDHPCPASPSGSAEYPYNVWTGVYWSRDGGRSWQNALMPGHPEDAANSTHPNRAWPCNSDPVVDFSEDGTVYFSGLGIRGSNVPDPTHPCVQGSSSIWLMRSTDGGSTWSDFSCVAAGTNLAGVGGVNVDKQWFEVEGEHVYFTYMAFNPTDLDLKFRHSSDGGATWDPEVTLFEFPTPENPDQVASGRQFSMPVAGPEGTVWVTWRAFGAEGGVYFVTSTNRGLSFDAPRRIAPIDPIPGTFFSGGYRVSSYPVLAASPSSQTLVVVWSDYATDDADLLYVRSEDGGSTWSDPARLNNDTVRTKDAHQFLPWATVSPNGDVHVVWLDARETKNATRLDVYYRVSRDGGATWDPELKLNAERIETDACHHQSGANFIGDYIGLAASGLAVHPFWPDGRDGKCNGITATVLR